MVIMSLHGELDRAMDAATECLTNLESLPSAVAKEAEDEPGEIAGLVHALSNSATIAENHFVPVEEELSAASAGPLVKLAGSLRSGHRPPGCQPAAAHPECQAGV